MTSKCLAAYLCCFITLNFQLLSAQDTTRTLPYTPPQKIEDLRPLFHFEPVNQDTTNACWSFSTISFIETEVQRIKNQQIKLSVVYPVYYAFIEKAKKFVETRGASRFKPGDLFTTVVEIIQTYGIVPEEIYRGRPAQASTYNHQELEQNIENLKERLLAENYWNEDSVLTEVKKILNKHLGEPPISFNYRGKEYTPLSFARENINIPWDEYVILTSFSYAPFNSFIILDVPDNWRRIDRYYNVPLDTFYQAMKKALQNGYSIAIDGDLSEPGRIGAQDIAYIPEYDIPGPYINQAARDYRFNQKITTDDHLMHLIGFGQYDGEEWFLVKDSWRDAWEGKFKGYFFYHSDFAKLKILAFMVHRDAIPGIIIHSRKQE
jgi:bleomycin hydrolase